MEQSPSETSSDPAVETEREYLDRIEESLNWHAAILAVLLQEAGGAVEIDEKDLVGIDLRHAKAEITYDPERKVYTIEGAKQPDES